MSPSYLNHPLLKNPLKWLRGVNKRHSSDLYLRNFYDTKNLDKNPFLETLLDTRLDLSRIRFPMGNMVQIVVAGNPKQKLYEITPVLEKPLAGQNPGSYVLNNQYYIQFLIQKRFAPIPLKYKHKSSSVIGAIKIPQDFSKKVEVLYKNRIEQLLEELPKSNIRESQTGRFVILKPDNSESVAWESNSSPVVYTSLVQQEISLSYAEDFELILLFLKLSAFIKV